MPELKHKSGSRVTTGRKTQARHDKEKAQTGQLNTHTRKSGNRQQVRATAEPNYTDETRGKQN